MRSSDRPSRPSPSGGWPPRSTGWAGSHRPRPTIKRRSSSPRPTRRSGTTPATATTSRTGWLDAERALKTADSIEPNNPRTLTNLGLTLAAQGKNDDALALLSRAGGPAVGHANLGYILAAMGKTEEARHHYDEAITLQPGLNAARLAIAKLDSQPVAPRTSGSIVATTPPLVVPAATQARTPPIPLPTLPTLPPNLTTTINRPVVKPATGDAQLKRTSASKPRRPLIRRTPKPPALDAAKVDQEFEILPLKKAE